MSKQLPINLEMLRWARDTSGHPIEDVARKMKKDVETVQAWENGRAFPTYIQLEKLAGLYKRPIAMLFFPEPPDEEPIHQSFRTLPDREIEKIPPRIRLLLRNSKVLQMNFSELCNGQNPADQAIWKDLRFSPEITPAEMALQARQYMNADLRTQKSWASTEDAFKNWREKLEDNGVLIFKDSFNSPDKKNNKIESLENSYSGFCLYDPDFPVIYINNNKPHSRQIFTLFHELAHLLMDCGGVDIDQSDENKLREKEYRDIEMRCNQFAAEFLVPGSDFNQAAQGMACNESSISKLAKTYCVSREVILRRFRDQEQCDDDYYQKQSSKWKNAAGGQKRKGGGNYYSNKGVHLGRRYIQAVFNRHYQGSISDEQAAEYLGVQRGNLPAMEDWLLKQTVPEY